MFKFAICCLLLMSAFYGAIALAEDSSAQAEDKTSLLFRWAIVAKIKSGGEETVKITGDTALQSGDMFKIYISPIRNAHIYVYLLDAEKRLRMIFPPSPAEFGKDYESYDDYYAPDENGWFVVDDNAGKTVVFLLASSERLTRLEELTDKYLKASDESKKTESGKVAGEIKEIKKSFSRFTTDAPTEPVSITGTTAGRLEADKSELIAEITNATESFAPFTAAAISREPNRLFGAFSKFKDRSVRSFATQIEAVNFFSKTINIELK